MHLEVCAYVLKFMYLIYVFLKYKKDLINRTLEKI